MQKFKKYLKITLISIICLILLIRYINSQNDYTIIGYYCGECYRNCVRVYLYENDNLYRLENIDLVDINLSGDRLIRKAKKIVVSDSIKTKIIETINSVPISILTAKPIVGEPDNRDQCGIYVSKKMGLIKKTVLIDTDESVIPWYFESFVKKMNKIRLL